MSNLVSHIGVFLLRCISRLPLWFIYRLSDLFYYLIYYLVGYRRKVVSSNLKNSFPEKSENELSEIKRKFYQHLCDITLETLIRFSKREKDFRKVIDLTEIEKVNEYFDKDISLFLLSFHYSNWELGRSIAAQTKHINLQVYNPQRNLIYDNFINQLRAEFGGIPVPTKRIYKKILEYSQIGKKTITFLIADQTPLRKSKFWTLFLNQETAFFPGPGRLAKSFVDQPILFYYFEKKGRGKYKLKVEVLIEDTSSCSEDDILKIYAEKTESIIRNAPEYYLWSHRRWKHKRPENIPLK